MRDERHPDAPILRTTRRGVMKTHVLWKPGEIKTLCGVSGPFYEAPERVVLCGKCRKEWRDRWAIRHLVAERIKA